MREPNLIEKITWFIQELPMKIKQMFCHHNFMTYFSATVFTVGNFDRCGGSAICQKCRLRTYVYVPRDDSEIERLLDQSK